MSVLRRAVDERRRAVDRTVVPVGRPVDGTWTPGTVELENARIPA